MHNLFKLNELKDKLLIRSNSDYEKLKKLKIGQKVDLISGVIGEIMEIDFINNRLRIKTPLSKYTDTLQMPEYDLRTYSPNQIIL